MQNNMYDTIILGAGPAGLSAAIYTARADLKTIVFGIPANSNAYKAHIIENYFGYGQQIAGPRLMEEGIRQAKRFGAEFVEREITDIHMKSDDTFTVTDSELVTYNAKTVIICSGLGFKPSGIKNEKSLTGKGVSFCVTCDGFFFKQKNVAVIGNENFAAEEALHLTSYTTKITILSHGKDFNFSPKAEEGLKKNNIQLIKSARITDFIGTSPLEPQGAPRLEKIKLADGSEMVFDGVFLALGHATAGDFANKLGIERTGPQNGFLVANPRTGETNVKGVYAAGDCTGGNAQAAKSAGEGCNAAISVIKHIKGVAAYVDYD